LNDECGMMNDEPKEKVRDFFMKGETVIHPLEKLDDLPGPYTMSFGHDPGPMIESIQKVGLINPPLVDTDEEGRVRIVAGYRRILALKSLGEKQVRCTDLSGEGLAASEKLLVAFYDNLATRRFNGMEKAMILQRLTNHFREEEVVSRYMPLLGLPSHRPTLHIYTRLNGLESELQAAFAKDGISPKTVRALLGMDSPSRSVCFKWLSNLNFNFNQQSQFIEFAIDLSLIYKKSISNLFAGEPFVSIISDEEMNTPQKAKAALNYLRSLRMPQLSRAERVFREMTRDLDLPKDVRLHHTPFFEGPDYRLELHFRNGEKLRELVLALASNERLIHIRDPWRGREE
jgi:hypothetical protein